MKPKLLLVDDQPEILDCFKQSGLSEWEVYTANCVKEASVMIDKIQFDLIVTDFHMPDGSGEHVRRIAASRGVPKVILHTSDTEKFSQFFHACFDKFDRNLFKLLRGKK